MTANTHDALRLKQALDGLRRELAPAYGPRLVRMVLYGSMARGDGALPDSDIDILVVLDGEVDALAESWRQSAAIAAISLEHDVVLSVVFVSRREYEAARTPLLMNVAREGVAV